MNDELKQLVQEIASIKLENESYQFPILQKPCGCVDGKIEVFSASEEEYKGLRKRLKAQGVKAPYWYDHPRCEGLGWIAVVSLGALFAALNSIGFNLVNFSTYGKVVVVETAIGVRSDGWTIGRVDGTNGTETMEEIRMLALAKALKNAYYKKNGME